MRESAAKIDAEIDDVPDLLVDHRLGQAKLRNLAADHAAGAGVAVVHDALVTERREIAGDGQRCRSGADQRDPLAVPARQLGQAFADIVLQVGRDTLKAADRDRLGLDRAAVGLSFLDAASATCRLARTIAGPAQNAGKDVRLPVDHVRVAVATRRDQPDVFRNGRMGWTRPLAVDDLVEVVGGCDVRRFQYCSSVRMHRHALGSDVRAMTRFVTFSVGRTGYSAAKWRRYYACVTAMKRPLLSTTSSMAFHVASKQRRKGKDSSISVAAIQRVAPRLMCRADCALRDYSFGYRDLAYSRPSARATADSGRACRHPADTCRATRGPARSRATRIPP